MRTRSVLFVTAGVVGAGVGGAAIVGAINDPELEGDPIIMAGVVAPAATDVGPESEGSASGAAGSARTGVDVTVRAVDGLDQLVGTLRAGDDPDDWYVSGVDVDFGPEGWIVAAPAFEDYDGDGTAEALLAELRGLEGREVTIGVRFDLDDDRDDAYAFTLQGLPYRDPSGGAPPWLTTTSEAAASPDQVAAAAAAAVGSGAIAHDVDRETDDGWTGWDVDVRSNDGREYDVYVDQSGSVVDVRADDDDSYDSYDSYDSGATSQTPTAPSNTGTTSQTPTAPSNTGTTSQTPTAPSNTGTTSQTPAAPSNAGTTSQAPTAPSNTGDASQAPVASGSIGAQQAAAIGASAAGGEAIDVWPGTEDGRSVYYVDVRTANGLVEVYVDATTGQVLEIEPGD
jgi:uncharacterized membrane protein YkoI